MITEDIVSSPAILYSTLRPETTQEFLQYLEEMVDGNAFDGFSLNVNFKERGTRKRVSPILKFATSEDAGEIVDICNEVYEGTYPYKEYTDVEAVRRKIESVNYQWFLFKNTKDETMGSFKFYLDFEQKKGYLGGFTVKKKHQGKVDVVKAMLGMMVVMTTIYDKQIFSWYCENRTAHSKTQYMVMLCGLKPVAFYPNKDVFMNKIESDLLQIIYDERTIKYYRSDKIPTILPQLLDCFNYSDKRYYLGFIRVKEPNLKIDHYKLVQYKNNLRRKVEEDEYGYESIRLTIDGSQSYFSFLYTPTVMNFEKTEYKVENLEELVVFINEFKKIAREYDIRYLEVFVSAYEPKHQKVFYDAGLLPRGYVPCWNYSKELDEFEDSILFSYNEGKIDNGIQLIDEAVELLKVLNLNN